MNRKWLLLAACLLLVGSTLPAQQIAGTWQGTLGTGPQSLRLILRIAKAANGHWTASALSIDQGGFDDPMIADSVSVKGRTLRIVFGAVHGVYEGTVSRNDSVITGTWTQRASEPLRFVRPTTATAWRDTSPHRSRFIAVDSGVKLEVLDWGGTGRPVVLLAGAGNSAHVFDRFAPKLTDTYHVYGITRRGFGFSSHPASGYLADSLADDVLAVLDSLHIQRPVLIGHSIAGEELSAIGSRHPERVAGLVYLDAGYTYAFYDTAQANLEVTIPDVRRKLAMIDDPFTTSSPAAREAMIRELLDTDLPQLSRGLRSRLQELEAIPDQTTAPPSSGSNRVLRALFAGMEKFTNVRAPVLAIFAAPHAIPAAGLDSSTRAKADSEDLARNLPQIHAFERGIPGARVVVIPHADHYVFRSNEAEVLREIRKFVERLSE